MFSDPLNADEVVASGVAVSNPFTTVSVNGNSTVRQNFTAAAGEPKVLKISHTKVGTGASERSRSLARMEAYALDDSGDETSTNCSIYVVLDKPVRGFTPAQLTELFKQFVGMLAGSSLEEAYAFDESAFLQRWSNGEA